MDFPESAPCANPVFYRTYSRDESPDAAIARATAALSKLGSFTPDEIALICNNAQSLTCLPSGRWLWVGGTPWIENPENVFGAYNCSTTDVDSIDAFGYLMNLAMQGCGTGANLEDRHIDKLPFVRNKLEVEIISKPGDDAPFTRTENTLFVNEGSYILIRVGDSRQGWVQAYLGLIELSMHQIRQFSLCSFNERGAIAVYIDLGGVRPAGEKLKGFGGTANPAKLPDLFPRIAEILNGAVGRQLTSVECCLLIDEAALVIVAGNIRRSAGLRLFDADDIEAIAAKDNLWQQGDDGQWRVDTKRDALRMANHTRAFHHKPDLQTCIESVHKQYYSGEGAIQWAGEAVARANRDLLYSPARKGEFLARYPHSSEEYFRDLGVTDPRELKHRLSRYSMNPCVTGDTWVFTNKGTWQVSDLIGKQFKAIVNGKAYPSTPEGFFFTGEKQVYKLTTREGYEIKTTLDHRFFKYSEADLLQSGVWVELGKLKAGDRIWLHDHRADIKEMLYRLSPSEKKKIKCSLDFRDFRSETRIWLGEAEDSLPDLQAIFLRAGIPTTIDRDLPEASLVISPLMADSLRYLLKESDKPDARFSELYLATIEAIAECGIEKVYDCTIPEVHCFDGNGFMVHNCGEIIGDNLLCNLAEVHLNRIDPENYLQQSDAFKAAALQVCALLHHQFPIERYRYSRQIDPIVGVSFTGLFDFFVNAFGVEWLQWWAEGRPLTQYGREFKVREASFLVAWREVVEETVQMYCSRAGIKTPNRTTCVQPGGTKSLLTGASPGWHPPKAQRFIRRITFGKNDPVALACIDYGYRVVPAQSDRDENGNLLNDPYSDRCTEWLVEIPVEVPWANLPGADAIAIEQFSALAQFDFYMQVQRHWTRHNTSATIEFRESEIEALGTRIYEAIRDDEGYISAALLARYDDYQSFPRLPFEPISKDEYNYAIADVLKRRKSDDFQSLLSKYKSTSDASGSVGPAGCDSDRCLLGDIPVKFD